MSLVARAMSPHSISRDASPIVGFSTSLPKYTAGPARRSPSAPAHADSVCAAFGLAWRRLSRRQMRAAPHTAIMNRADNREGIQFTASSRRAEAQPKSM